MRVRCNLSIFIQFTLVIINLCVHCYDSFAFRMLSILLFLILSALRLHFFIDWLIFCYFNQNMPSITHNYVGVPWLKIWSINSIMFSMSRCLENINFSWKLHYFCLISSSSTSLLINKSLLWEFDTCIITLTFNSSRLWLSQFVKGFNNRTRTYV